MKPSPYGTHRVIEPLGVLPQAANRIDNSMTLHDNEMRIDVTTLNIDSASFTQIKQACHHDLALMEAMILEIVSTRGKMQNPVTGSGGMLLGTIAAMGKDFPHDYPIGTEIATLVSLSLTPLVIDKIIAIHPEKDQVDIVGKAILFSSGIYAPIPHDINRHLALSALDVAGAPAQVKRLIKPGQTVLIIGAAGKSGILCAYQAKKSVGNSGRVIGVVNDPKQIPDLASLEVADEILIADATNPLQVMNAVLNANKGEKVDVTINVVNVPNTEMASILPTKDDGIVYFFGMATSFQKAALGAEGVASEATLQIGNGYTRGHAQLTLDLLRESKLLTAIFMRRYGPKEETS